MVITDDDDKISLPRPCGGGGGGGGTLAFASSFPHLRDRPSAARPKASALFTAFRNRNSCHSFGLSVFVNSRDGQPGLFAAFPINIRGSPFGGEAAHLLSDEAFDAAGAGVEAPFSAIRISV